MAEKKVNLEDLNWARNKLSTFLLLERDIRKELGRWGIEKLVINNPLYLGLIFFSLFISSIGVFFLYKEKDPLYLITLLAPIGSGIFIRHHIQQEKKKNIFRFLGKFPIPEEKFQSIIQIIEDYIFEEREPLEEIIAWKVNQSIKSSKSNKELQKFTYVFDISYWRDLRKAKSQCITLAILMVSLQKFLHTHRRTYEELIKKVPTMNIGYKFDPKKNSQPKVGHLNGLTTEDLFTGTGDY